MGDTRKGKILIIHLHKEWNFDFVTILECILETPLGTMGFNTLLASIVSRKFFPTVLWPSIALWSWVTNGWIPLKRTGCLDKFSDPLKEFEEIELEELIFFIITW